MRVRTSLFLFAGALGISAALASADTFNPGNLVVTYLEGQLNSAGNPRMNDNGASVTLREYTTSGVYTGNNFAFASGTVGPRLVIPGNSSSVGHLSLSGDGTRLITAGLDAQQFSGNGQVLNSTANRMIGVVTLAGAGSYHPISDHFGAGTGGLHISAAASQNGSSFYAVGGSNPTHTGGLRSITPPATTTTRLNSADTVFNGLTNVHTLGTDVYVSARTTGPGAGGSGGLWGIGKFNSTTNTIDPLPGFPTSTPPSPSPNALDFVFANPNLLYIADDNLLTQGGGVQRWDFNGTIWSKTYTLGTSALTPAGAIDLTINPSTGMLYVVTNGYNAAFDAQSTGRDNKIISIMDNGSALGSTYTQLASTTLGDLTGFRGIEFIVPAPSSVALLGMGGLLAARRRRSR